MYVCSQLLLGTVRKHHLAETNAGITDFPATALKPPREYTGLL